VRTLLVTTAVCFSCGGHPGTPDGGGRRADAAPGGSADAAVTTNIDGGAASDVCAVGQGVVAWSAPVTGGTPGDVGVGSASNDVVVSVFTSGATYEQHRWDKAGGLRSTHQDTAGAYPGAFVASNLTLDSSDDVYYALLRTGMQSGSNTAAQLSFTRLGAAGNVDFLETQDGAMPSSTAAPSLPLFQSGWDSGGGLHTTVTVNDGWFPEGVYCWSSDGSNLGASADPPASSLRAGDYLWPMPEGNLFMLQAVSAAVSLGCSTTPSVPAEGATLLAKLTAGGSCLLNTALALPAAAIQQRAARVGPGDTLVFAVVYTGTIDFGDGAHTAGGTTSLAVAEFDTNLNVLWSRSFGGSGSDFVLGSVGANATGDVVVSSRYAGVVDLGGGPLASSADTFVAAFDPTGNLRWARTASAASAHVVAGIGPCGVSVATDGASADFGAGPAPGGQVLVTTLGL
jgi:hypothetical protein